MDLEAQEDKTKLKIRNKSELVGLINYLEYEVFFTDEKNEYIWEIEINKMTKPRSESNE